MRGVQWPAAAVAFCVCALLTYGAAVTLGRRAIVTVPQRAPDAAGVAVRRTPRKQPYTFPGGRRQLLPDYRLVALYGAPHEPALGVLGTYEPQEAATAARDVAAQYQPFSAQHVLPTWEIIATVASASPTDNGDYSRETDPALLREWVDVARQNGIYVVLDFQPGRSDFLTQVQAYKDLIDQPHVGVALDPEWRLGPDQMPLEQIGAVNVAEPNAVAQWLAGEVQAHHLPQKLFLLHQFRLSMLPERDRLDTTHRQLAYVIQMDGQGAPSAKFDTWQAITQSPPADVQFGWKNFYAKDMPMLDVQQTAHIQPAPVYISYQ